MPRAHPRRRAAQRRRHPRRRRRRCGRGCRVAAGRVRADADRQHGTDRGRQRPGRLQRSLRPAELQRQPERADRPARGVLVRSAGRRPAAARRPRPARPGRGHGLARDHRQGQSAGQAGRARPQGQGARARAPAAFALCDQVLGLRHRARQDERRPRLRRAARRPAQREQPDRPQPARVRREGRGLDREPAGQARRGAARRPQRRDRRRPAGERLDQRSAVLALQRGHEGDRQPHRQGA